MKGSTALKLISIAMFLALFSVGALCQSQASSTQTDESVNALTQVVEPTNSSTQVVESTSSTAQAIESTNNTNAADLNSVPAGTRDVTKLANLNQIFTANKSEALKIYNVNHAGDSWVEIYNSGITPRNLTGWSLTNKENSKLVLPKLDLGSRSSIRVHPGEGVSSGTDLYMNSASSWMDSSRDVITLQDTTGRTIFTYTY
ncbi:MAG TPA: lamin tail domain-containing protein [Methanotrichaceae archaeon]|nr:lamin tail domain-containing protein [Methanotrichaceae archaeon]